MAEPEVIVEADEAALATAVAERTIANLSAAIGARGFASVVLTGGGILEKVFTALAEQASTAVDWSLVDVYWGDERFVAADSPDRNDLPVRRQLLDRLPFDAARIHPMPSTDGPDGTDVEAAARRYSDVLADAAQAAGAAAIDGKSDPEVPNFDVVLLGVGPDGHCCSLFPHQPGVQEESLSVIAVHDSPKPPPTRISLTFRALAAAEEIWVIAAGSGKANAVAQALGGASREAVPSAGARGRRRTLWLLDRDAAAQLPDRR